MLLRKMNAAQLIKVSVSTRAFSVIVTDGSFAALVKGYLWLGRAQVTRHSTKELQLTQ